MAAASLDAVLKRDRLIVLASLAAIALLAWLYLFHTAGGMAAMDGAAEVADMPGMAMPPASAEWFANFAFLALMWLVMMVGMMLPSATPTILLFTALERQRAAADWPHGRASLFVAGSFLAWGGFAVAAAFAQAALARAGLLSPDMAATSAVLGGAIFVIAGLYEFTPLKKSCLTHCRSPIDWLVQHRRSGRLGALRMGMEHGAYCVGCCWALMLLLFVGGVMSLLWVAAIAAIVLVQKLLPGGALVARLAGVAMLAAGALLILQPLLMA